MAIKTREDSWTPEQDVLLVNTVLEYIATGKTQLAAFENVADKLERTPAAVGFRFNAVVRHKYQTEMDKAKKIRVLNRRKKDAPAAPVVEVTKEEVEEPIKVVKEMITKENVLTSDLSIYQSVGDILKKFAAMEKRVRELEKENAELKAMKK